MKEPSHFGSKLRPPCRAGSATPLTLLASIGCTGGITGRSTPHAYAVPVPMLKG